VVTVRTQQAPAEPTRYPEDFYTIFPTDAQVVDQNNGKDSDSFSVADFEYKKSANNNEGEENTVQKIESPYQNFSGASSFGGKKRPSSNPIKITVSQRQVQAPTINYVGDFEYNLPILSQPYQLKVGDETSISEVKQTTMSKLGSLAPVGDPEGLSNIASVDVQSGTNK
jgi:hypothetical protein